MSLRLVKYFKGPAFEAADWTSQNPTLARGEIGYLLSSGTVIGAKVGEGAWNSLDFFGKKLVSKLHTLNVTGAASSGSGVGFEIEEGGSITGYLKTNSARTGFLFNSPANPSDAEFLLSSLTASRSYTLPDKSGTIALVEDVLGVTLNSGQIIVGNASNVATAVTLSGDGTISNTGVLTINDIDLSTQVTGVLPIANGGTGSSTVFAEGRIIYIGAGGAYSTDDRFNWDATNNVLLIGESTSSIKVHSGNVIGGTFVGYNAGNSTLSGQRNTAIGDAAGTALTNATNNTFLGSGSGVAVTSGSSNTFLGYRSGYSNTTGANNVAIGSSTLYAVTSSSGNIAIGYNAGRYYTGANDLTAATNSIYIGYEATASANSAVEEVVIGHQAVGYGSNTTTIGGPANTTNYFVGDINLTTAPVNDDSISDILVRDSATGLVKYRTATSLVSYAGTENYVLKWGAGGTSLGTSAIFEDGTKTSITYTSAATNTVVTAFEINAQTSGTPAVNFGVGINLTAEASTGPTNTFNLSKINALVSNSTVGTEAGKLTLTALTNGTEHHGFEITSSNPGEGLTKKAILKPYSASGDTLTMDITVPGSELNITSTALNLSPSQSLFAFSDIIYATSYGGMQLTGTTNLELVTTATLGVKSRVTSTSVNTITTSLRLIKGLTVEAGAAGVGVGVGLSFEAQTGATTGVYTLGGNIDVYTTSITTSTESFDMSFKLKASGVIAEKFAIQSNGYVKLPVAPAQDDGLTQLLVRDGATGIIKYRSAASIGSVGSGHAIYNGASPSALTQRANLRITNGLSAVDSSPDTLVKLGGTLIENTTVDGAFSLNFNNSNVSLFNASPVYNSGVNTMFFAKATTRPSSPPTNGVYIWVEEEPVLIPGSGTYRLMIMDSYGNIKAI